MGEPQGDRARRPTIADVAQRAGVSKGLVSFALNDRPGVNVATRERILAIAAELGWAPDLRARSLSTNRSFALGLVLQRDTAIVAGDPFFPAFIAGVERELSTAGQALVLASVPSPRREADTYRKLASERRVDGVFLADLRGGDERLELVQSLGLAAVTLGHPDVPSPFPAVSVDDIDGVVATVAHLVELGHRSIAHVAGSPEMLHARRRRTAFERACEDRGVAHRVVDTDFSARQGGEATRALLADAARRPTAICYSNDVMAMAGIAVAQRAGLSVPGDLSIAGFDDSELARHVYPSLTSVATDAVEWGAAAARTLLAAIAGDAIDDSELAPARLVVRESTGAAPAPPRDMPR
ncbi:LacI family transcriptional regulator [Microbacterium sp. zg.B48]|uniref:LacI family DNA-binding transcriptional regulator n=1 Tax=Microbacterium sp. zg.B48 TaxID=2969408 RepID=UPI00214BAAA8|nr:LacI family DNA-binding transcriptional regulator [Microbacterium sp. zg.B48]MCR2764048.1 LacI family transcriptional regulator [Microbacterium sp. zg.B48]